MIVASPFYRLNPARAIHISGMINRELVSRITPEIIRLQSQNRDPITVYIDSPGGIVQSAESILRLLRLPDQDSSSPCRIITTVATHAASAAADLLSSGDYSTAFPASTILYHGVRTFDENPLTLEKTSMLANVLRASNNLYARELARKIEYRFSLRYVYARKQFDAIRAEKGKLDDLGCFVDVFIPEKLSAGANKLWDRAKERHDSYRNIFTAAMRNMSRLKTPSVVAKLEAASLKAIVDFEVRRNKNNPAWTFREQGISRLVEDFFLLDEYITGFESERFRNWSTSWYRHLLSQQSIDEIETIADEKLRTDAVVKKVSPLITPVLAFFGALCHALQEGENQLSATDAYWLGLIDEVIGDNTLMSLRMIEEYRPDESEKKQEEDADKQTGVSAGA